MIDEVRHAFKEVALGLNNFSIVMNYEIDELQKKFNKLYRVIEKASNDRDNNTKSNKG